jgi:hypothetical protein
MIIIIQDKITLICKDIYLNLNNILNIFIIKKIIINLYF